MLDKIAKHFHENYYSDLPLEDVRAQFDNPEVVDTAMAHIAGNGHPDPQIVDAAQNHKPGKPLPQFGYSNILQVPLNDNQTVQELFQKYPILNTFSKPEDYLVQDAQGKMLDILKKNKYALEFQNKGETNYQVGNDKMTLDNPDKHRLYINPELTTPDKRQEAIKLDILSHALHNNPRYNEFQKDLRKRLVEKYGEKMVVGNDDVDAYVRGYLSNSKEYQPYKEELKFLPPGYFNQLENILQNK